MSLADEMMIRAYTLSNEEFKMMADQVKLPTSKFKKINIIMDTIQCIVKTSHTTLITTLYKNDSVVIHDEKGNVMVIDKENFETIIKILKENDKN